VQGSLDPFLACLDIASSAAFEDCYPNGEVVGVADAVIAGCEVIAVFGLFIFFI